MVHEYELSGQPPMMTHVYQQGETQLVAAKGAAEKIIAVCAIGDSARTKINGHVNQLASKGYRVIGVASAVHHSGPFPELQEDFQWNFEGLLCLYDPPRKNMDKFFQQIYQAKIAVKLLTGDYPETAVNIAEQVGIHSLSEYKTGEQVMKMNEEELKETVERTTIFARMFPDAKLKVINALKSAGEIVAMTGDGVNDGPALKSADIGIAMGKKGTEIARQAADLVLTDDNPEKIIAAIYQGRKIFYNLKKAIRYILSIHIPIILTASLPVLLGWKFPNVFTPVHVIFLELIMGPTCSIFFEREPVEKDSMKVGPRDRSKGLFSRSEILISLVQGIVLSSGILSLYYISMSKGQTLEVTRAIVFTTLILGNIFLTFVNRSFTESIVQTIRYKNNLAPWIFLFSGILLILVHQVSFIRDLFGFMPITALQFWQAAAVAFISVMWFEVYKMIIAAFRKKKPI
jgi:Ca2+-transporting ATPase